jgi:hypothetical protein
MRPNGPSQTAQRLGEFCMKSCISVSVRLRVSSDHSLLLSPQEKPDLLRVAARSHASLHPIDRSAMPVEIKTGQMPCSIVRRCVPDAQGDYED